MHPYNRVYGDDTAFTWTYIEGLTRRSYVLGRKPWTNRDYRRHASSLGWLSVAVENVTGLVHGTRSVVLSGCDGFVPWDAIDKTHYRIMRIQAHYLPILSPLRWQPRSDWW